MLSQTIRTITIILGVLCIIGSFIVGNQLADIFNEGAFMYVVACLAVSALDLVPLFTLSIVLDNQDAINENLHNFKSDFDKFKKENTK